MCDVSIFGTTECQRPTCSPWSSALPQRTVDPAGRSTIVASDTKSRNAAFLPACAVRSSLFRVLTLRSRTDRQR
eukprot:1159299-Prymnesium_polylepis.1